MRILATVAAALRISRALAGSRLRYARAMRERERHYLQHLNLPDIAPRTEE